MTVFDKIRFYVKLRRSLLDFGKHTPLTFVGVLELLKGMLYYTSDLEDNTRLKALYKQQGNTFRSLLSLLSATNKEATMADLGITPAEIMSALPTLLSEAWGHFADDKKITGDEGVLLVATLLELMAERTDNEDYAEFFGAQAAAFRIFAGLLEEQE